jgi:hypothetical protein
VCRVSERVSHRKIVFPFVFPFVAKTKKKISVYSFCSNRLAPSSITNLITNLGTHRTELRHRSRPILRFLSGI